MSTSSSRVTDSKCEFIKGDWQQVSSSRVTDSKCEFIKGNWQQVWVHQGWLTASVILLMVTDWMCESIRGDCCKCAFLQGIHQGWLTASEFANGDWLQVRVHQGWLMQVWVHPGYSSRVNDGKFQFIKGDCERQSELIDGVCSSKCECIKGDWRKCELILGIHQGWLTASFSSPRMNVTASVSSSRVTANNS